MKLTNIITLSAIAVLSLTVGTTLVTAAPVNNYDSNGAVEFTPNLDPTSPVDPLDPDPENPVTPIDPTKPDGKPTDGTQGPLSIDFASSLDFGLNKISNKDQTYYARAQKFSGGTTDKPNYVQVSDNRGSNAGWNLTVKQVGQFTATTPTVNDVLKNAAITLTSPTVKSNSTAEAPTANDTIELVPDGPAVLVMSAAVETGAGTWDNSWGTVEEVTEKDADNNDVKANVTKAVTLFVPGSTLKDAVKYQTKLTWELADVPANP